MTLSGANTFNGGTTLSAGRLVLGDAAALSAGPLTVAGAARLDTLAATTLSNALALNSTLTLDCSQDLTLAGTITGAGGLVKNGAGTLTLAGVNAYCNTTINAGTVNTGAANLGTSVVNNGTLVFTQNQTGTYAGSISGNGAVTLEGASTLTLSGNNTFTGGMNIVRGTLETLGGNALADSVAVSVGADARLRLTDSEVLWGNFLLGLGQSISFTPMTVMAFSTLPPRQVTEGSAVFTLMRNFGSSLFISVAVLIVSRSTASNYSRMTEYITPYNKTLTEPGLPPQWSLDGAASLQTLSNEILRQAAMIGYLNAFYLMAFAALAAMPLAAFMRGVKRDP